MLKFVGFVAMIDIEGVAVAYVDTNIFIYFVESSSTLGERARAWIDALRHADIPLVVSRLTLLECLYGPAKHGDEELISAYRNLLEDASIVEMQELEHHILKDAAMKGGKLGLKLQDSIHYFTALHCHCDLLLTNDARFRSTGSMRVMSINPSTS
ncbi:type II toxin-antitoxin system VapC family toxin [Rhizobium sp. TH2]|uniref:type II toxin-antitoxin system VapC family toxin n=1 Tax=Rhizobium sp. TH2 TaxID=2775403 RepID=UPI00215748B2|nr:type II toxin-antitoxin system VapC family toxin [Rhizobium sp. TH2]UVC09648.1 type II toxin-antitoxin system VapC family toxin [Rhizobium sp. TH2]